MARQKIENQEVIESLTQITWSRWTREIETTAPPWSALNPETRQRLVSIVTAIANYGGATSALEMIADRVVDDFWAERARQVEAEAVKQEEFWLAHEAAYVVGETDVIAEQELHVVGETDADAPDTAPLVPVLTPEEVAANELKEGPVKSEDVVSEDVVLATEVTESTEPVAEEAPIVLQELLAEPPPVVTVPSPKKQKNK